MSLPRGLKNNNPGNIVKDKDVWQGEVVPSRDSRFKQFIDRPHGYRAMFVNLNSYIKKGHNTVAKIINRWAPAFENNTEGYISSVIKITGIGRDTVISASDSEVLLELAKSISRIENGVNAVEQEVIAGFELWKRGVLKKKVVFTGLGIVTAGLIIAGIYALIKSRKK